jgi:hypothetical protein
MVGTCEQSNESSGPLNGNKFLALAERHLPPQDGPYSMELVLSGVCIKNVCWFGGCVCLHHQGRYVSDTDCPVYACLVLTKPIHHWLRTNLARCCLACSGQWMTSSDHSTCRLRSSVLLKCGKILKIFSEYLKHARNWILWSACHKVIGICSYLNRLHP